MALTEAKLLMKASELPSVGVMLAPPAGIGVTMFWDTPGSPPAVFSRLAMAPKIVVGVTPYLRKPSSLKHFS